MTDLTIVSRDGWGAAPPRSASTIVLPAPDVYLHHTAGSEPDGPDGVRRVQKFHMGTRGYHDIAYSFVVDRNGVAYVGRGAGIAGAHTKGHNTTAHAICVLGHYDRESVPVAVIETVAALLVHGWRQAWWTSPALTGGHRDVGSTSCPGDNLYWVIENINRRAAELAERGDVVTLAQAVVVPKQEAHLWDRPLGAAIAQGYGLALVDSDQDGNLTHEGRPARITDFTIVVGGGTKHPRDPDAIRLAGGDRFGTAKAVFEFIRAHDPDEWARRGRPY